MEIKKFEINEKMARTAKELNSFSDYKTNSATNEYNYYLDKFSTEVERLKSISKIEITAEIEEQIQYWADRYSYKLAEAKNKYYSIECMCPSVMIAGPANFPIRKKEKQNNARDNWNNQYNSLFTDNNYYISKIRNILLNTTIYSNDEFAIEKLQNRIEDLEKYQQFMKDINSYYRKNKTLEDCELLSETEKNEILKKMSIYSWYDVPFAPYNLQNNNAEIKRNKQRLEELKRLKERANQATEDKYIKVDGLEVVEDATDMRIRILFDDIPSAEIREILKSNGFKWSPKNSAWQRQLTSNGIYATKQVLEKIKNVEM